MLAVLEWVRARSARSAATRRGSRSAASRRAPRCVADLLVCPGRRRAVHAARSCTRRRCPRPPATPSAARAGSATSRVDAPRRRPTTIVARHEALLQRGRMARARAAPHWPTLDADAARPRRSTRPDARLDIPVLVGTTRDEATFLLRTGGRDAPDEQVAERSPRSCSTSRPSAGRARARGRRRGPPLPHRALLARPAPRRAAHDRRPAAVRHVPRPATSPATTSPTTSARARSRPRCSASGGASSTARTSPGRQARRT